MIDEDVRTISATQMQIRNEVHLLHEDLQQLIATLRALIEAVDTVAGTIASQNQAR
ncbi:MAG TPA: hypothetical protein VE961_11735 [Pyrinomonadaceae bacterium]|nr:hypothetical protein [Pyrinomonadaceae bacterium]